MPIGLDFYSWRAKRGRSLHRRGEYLKLKRVVIRSGNTFSSASVICLNIVVCHYQSRREEITGGDDWREEIAESVVAGRAEAYVGLYDPPPS